MSNENTTREAEREWRWRRECPRFEGGAQSDYREWKGLVEDWIDACGREFAYPGLEVRMSLRGKALRIVEEIDRDSLKKNDGPKLILEHLDKVYLKDSLVDNFDKMNQYFVITRESGEKMRDYIVRYEKAASECSRAMGGKRLFEGEGKGFHLIVSANLTETQKQMILSACGKDKLDYEAVAPLMKRIFEGLGNKDHEWWGSENNIGSGRGKENIRNRSRPRPRWMRGRGGRNPTNKEGKVTVCAICSSEWHWARECPQNYNNKKQHSENQEIETRPGDNPEKENSEENIYIGEVRELDGESWGEIDAILDTGCKSTVCGEL